MNLRYEKAKLKNGYRYIIGCDEVGRGSLAGPVVACAVVLDLSCKIKDFREIRDSKLVSAKNREKLSGQIKKGVLGWAIGRVDEKVAMH
ncbi:MAG: ribonuclease HII, partial [Patescibacteria group bacterium]|nr:ribonuclease HII [Patescibacteria group bacterium]